MNLHKNKELFSQAIRLTAQRMGIPEIYIEKDYWICVALKIIFESKISEDVVFKGGIALSKCFSLIERFSEDVDVVILKDKNISDSQLLYKYD